MKTKLTLLKLQATGWALMVSLTGAAVAAAPQTFDQWAEQLPAELNGPNDDADGDGILNVVEYALGMNPLVSGSEGLPTVTADNGVVTYSFTRPKSVVGVAHFVRASSVVTEITQLLNLTKLSETETTETWGATISGSSATEFVWSSLVKLTPPALSGHAGSARPAEYEFILPYDIQAAFNNDTFFWRVRYPGEEGMRHDYLRYTGGAWRAEGSTRRDAQATIDGDPLRGSTSAKSTLQEQRTSIMINDPNAISHVVNFDRFACFLTCHNKSQNMPEWTSAAGEDTKYVDPSHVSDGAVNSDKVLDLWHWRGARSNPIWRADDQYIQAKSFENSTAGDDGGRKGDAGTSVFANNGIVNGNPAFVFDPATTGGKYAFNWEDFWATPLNYLVRANAADLGPNRPNPVVLPWADAVAAGYTPVEGDTVPRRILAAGDGSRADITAFGSRFLRETPDTVFGDAIMGTWEVQMQRSLNTGSNDDVQLVPGNTYHAGFEVHLWGYASRDHYVSYPQSFSLGGEADIPVADLRGPGADGRASLPDWDDTDRFPVKRIYLFMPGISSWDFLAGNNTGKAYLDPVSGQNVDQAHFGAASVNNGVACSACHSVRDADPAPPLFNAGSMEALNRQRGGIWAQTPILQP